ncbi:uncharacterized protein LOC143032765 isoform X3 [Oratosquilla oratoria]|uniref:uncharacterized protein LOC143032765 isoform X3 n=1 Tax=Oratosquilla oratoria TaxID=337810 RepID=UPI003F759C56
MLNRGNIGTREFEKLMTSDLLGLSGCLVIEMEGRADCAPLPRDWCPPVREFDKHLANVVVQRPQACHHVGRGEQRPDPYSNKGFNGTE